MQNLDNHLTVREKKKKCRRPHPILSMINSLRIAIKSQIIRKRTVENVL